MRKEYQILVDFLLIPTILFFIFFGIIYLAYTKLRYKKVDWTFYRHGKFWRVSLISYIIFLIVAFVFVFILNGMNVC